MPKHTHVIKRKYLYGNNYKKANNTICNNNRNYSLPDISVYLLLFFRAGKHTEKHFLVNISYVINDTNRHDLLNFIINLMHLNVHISTILRL